MTQRFNSLSKFALAAICCLAPALKAQTPAIAAGGVFNVASYVPAGLPSAAIAQGSLFVIFGSAMGPTALTQAAALPLATSLAGTSITVTIGGTTTKPLMFYTSATQIGALMPSSTPVGTGTITVTYNNATSATQPVTVAPSSVGIFTVNQAGSGPGIITTAKYAVNTLTTAAAAGDVNIIWATGLGPVGATGSEASGTAPVAGLPGTFKVFVGGVAATIVGAARSQSPGLDQIAFTVPAGVTGCHVPVVVQTGNVISNYVTMAIGTGGLCSDPVGTGLTPTQLTQLQQQGTVSTGAISLARTALSLNIPGVPAGLGNTTSDTGSATFSRYTFQQYTASTGGINVTTFGACSVYFVTGSNLPVDPTLPVGLDAGSPISISGPGGTKTLTAQSKGNYSATLGSNTSSLYLSPGTYNITSPGGVDVGAFNTSITLPPTLTWTNASSVSTINRPNGQLITWTGGDPAGVVEILGFSAVSAASNAATAGFVCTAKTSDLQFTIPSVVLLALPPTPPGGILSGAFGYLGLTAVSATKSFTAKGLDLASIIGSSSTAQTVTYQ